MAFITEPVQPVNVRQPSASRLLLEEYSLLFYIGKCLGISSQDYEEFRKHKRLKKSPGGDCYVIIVMIIVVINFNLMVGVFDNSVFVEEKNLLSVVIGYVLTYFSLVSYLVDRITALRNQNSFLEIFDTLQDIQEDFEDLGLQVNNSFIKYRITFALAYAVTLEVIIFLSTFLILVDRSSWTAWLWTFTAVPTFSNSLDKIWYLSVIRIIEQRFELLNQELQRLTENLQSKKIDKKKFSKTFSLSSLKVIAGPKLNSGSDGGGGSTTKVFPQKPQQNNNFPITTVSSQQYFQTTIFQTSASNASTCSTRELNTESFSPVACEIVEERFSKICQLHDSLCELAKQLNELWAVPNLLVMGYCFFIITAQLYFLYCSNAGQAIPTLFRPASSVAITAINLIYVASKCIRILHLNWCTSLAAKKTGICLHRYAMASDNNEVYEMINHLSLKLFNHDVAFNACGFFSLDMATLFAFCGGITTYLIILIQFNIEEQQVRSGGIQSMVDTESPPKMLPRNMTTLFNMIFHNYFGNGVNNSN